MTPLPNVTTHFMMVVQLIPRDPNEPVGEDVEIPPWHPAGGEGPVIVQ